MGQAHDGLHMGMGNGQWEWEWSVEGGRRSRRLGLWGQREQGQTRKTLASSNPKIGNLSFMNLQNSRRLYQNKLIRPGVWEVFESGSLRVATEGSWKLQVGKQEHRDKYYALMDQLFILNAYIFFKKYLSIKHI